MQLYIMGDPESTDPDLGTELEGIFEGAFKGRKPGKGERQPG